MLLEGKVLYLNKRARVAVVDIGWGEAVVIEFEAAEDLCVGDVLQGLKRCYFMSMCYNDTKQRRIPVTVLSGGLPMETARYVVTSELEVDAVA